MEWDEAVGAGPIVAVALHDGSEMRPSLRDRSALSPEERRQEEDPGTGPWARLAPTWLVARCSRYEVDLNRSPEKVVYLTPDEAWGRVPWRGELPAAELVTSRAIHSRFYARLGEVLDRKVAEEGGFVLLDVHSYNHRRGGPDAPAADPEGNPEVNVGTSNLDRARWGDLVARFIDELRESRELPGLDVRADVRFLGGWLCRWSNLRHPERSAALAIEFKKTYIDEWSGEIDAAAAARLGDLLRRSFCGLEESLWARVSRRAGSRGA